MKKSLIVILIFAFCLSTTSTTTTTAKHLETNENAFDIQDSIENDRENSSLLLFDGDLRMKQAFNFFYDFYDSTNGKYWLSSCKEKIYIFIFKKEARFFPSKI